jgi:hypothetical protein
MDRRLKAALNRSKGPHLNDTWGVGAAQARYSHDGHWYAQLSSFPAAHFDAHGYVLFSSEAEYRASKHLRIGKHISVPMPGISAMPTYVRVLDPEAPQINDIDIHTFEATEGQRRLRLHLERERRHGLVRRKKLQAVSLDCEVCGFSFGRTYGEGAAGYCEVHHLVPLAEVERSTRTRMQDLAIVCANCHRVIHLRTPPYKLEELRTMLAYGCGGPSGDFAVTALLQEGNAPG